MFLIGSRDTQMIRPTLIALCLSLVLFAVCAPSQEREADRGEADLVQKLDARVTLVFNRTPLYEAIESIAGESKTKIELDGDALKFNGYTKNMPQTLTVKTRRAREVIGEILKRYPPLVVCVDRQRKRFLVTTAAAAKQQMLEAVSLERESDEWHRLMVEAVLQRLTKRTLRDMNAELKDRAGYKYVDFDRHLTTMIILAQVADSHGDNISWSAKAGSVEGLAFKLRESLVQRAESYAGMKKGVAELSRMIEGGKTVAYRRPKIDDEKELTRLMKRLRAALKRLDAAAGEQKLTDDQRQAAIDEATLVSVIADSLRQSQPRAADADWREHARKLKQASIAIKRSDAIQPRMEAFKQTCNACHGDYR